MVKKLTEKTAGSLNFIYENEDKWMMYCKFVITLIRQSAWPDAV